jgi:UDP-N-acetylglucosamine diphosphorylase/glucosamine-1-phosphate N-acetyltransferase
MIVIIMAGGLGKRMESDLPKVLHQVVEPSNINTKYPMLIHVINTSIKLNPTKIFVVVGKYKNIIEETINKYMGSNNLIEYVIQEPALGTAHAIRCSLSSISNYCGEKALILSGDVPLISINTLKGLDGNKNKLLITELENPYGCGRILLNSENKIIGIKEEKDCEGDEKKIKLVNCGIYCINVKHLIELIPQINNNNKSQEYYLTDIIDLMVKNNIDIETYELEKTSQWEIKNVNTKKDLEELNDYITKMNIV